MTPLESVLAAHGLTGARVTPLGAGLDNSAMLVGDDVVLRFGRDGAAVAREARLLAFLAPRAPVPVPVPLFHDEQAACLAYPLLPGTPLVLAPAGRARAVPQLRDFVAWLHAQPAPDIQRDDTPLRDWLAQARDDHAAVRELIPDRHRRAVEDFLRADPPPDTPHRVLAHNDLGAEHILVDAAGTVTGIIDWTDAALADPAVDHARLLRDLGPAYRDPARDERALFLARCLLLEDLAYGVDAYAANSLTALSWLFAPGRVP
ncbi:phosphotransferase family protein [Actinoplanes sp. RD1]|uniref:phosphotransferase family protein n=1 Tax=Actinoplanes sp. RD1 TaxID=3064538 RepID=UPI00274280E6|nr:aminoglycoside phosphotransferase family protein [Actinoplanes sp. RD1]